MFSFAPTGASCAALRSSTTTMLSGRKVDLNTPKFLSRYFRDEVLKEAEVQYVQT